nr:hypothetical protein [uncultured Fusobacterium sp.]
MKFKKIILGTILSAFLLQGCSAVMALSGGDNPDFKVIAKGSSKAQIEKQPIKAVFSETQKNGNTIVKYQYVTGKESSPGRAAAYIGLDLITLFISELFTMPAEIGRTGVDKNIFVEYNAQGEAIRVF